AMQSRAYPRRPGTVRPVTRSCSRAGAMPGTARAPVSLRRAAPATLEGGIAGRVIHQAARRAAGRADVAIRAAGGLIGMRPHDPLLPVPLVTLPLGDITFMTRVLLLLPFLLAISPWFVPEPESVSVGRSYSSRRHSQC